MITSIIFYHIWEINLALLLITVLFLTIAYYPYNNDSTQTLKHVLESSDLFGYLFVSINKIFLHVKHINTLEK